jgi:hypothetical protein
MNDMETKFQVWSSPAACAQRKENGTKEDVKKNKGKKLSDGGKKVVGADTKATRKGARMEASELLSEEDPSYTNQLDEPEGSRQDNSGKCLTRSSYRAATGSRLPVPEDSGESEDGGGCSGSDTTSDDDR